MTKRDYELIAKVLKTNREETTRFKDVVSQVAMDLCTALRETSPRFDYRRFLEACGVPEEEWNQ